MSERIKIIELIQLNKCQTLVTKMFKMMNLAKAMHSSVKQSKREHDY